MKKLGKLTINPSKVMNNEELVNLKGGYGGYGSCDPTAGLFCSKKCTTSIGTSGECKPTFIGSKIMCACVED